MTSLTYDYQDCYLYHQLWPMTMIYDLWLWPMTYDYDLWPITMIYDLWLSLITHNCHSWLSMTMTDHMSLMTYSEPWLITYDHCSWLSRTITHDYQGLSLMTIIHDYEQYLWTSPMTIRPYDLWFITCEYHTRLLPMTIIHDYEHHTWLCPSHDLPQLTMTAAHDYDCHSWLWISLTIYHHSWLAYITRDYHLCMSPMTVTDPLSLVMTTYHPWHSSHKIITHDHDYHSSLMTMTSYSQLAPMPYHSCLIIHVLSLMAIYDHHDLWLMTYDLWFTTHHSWLSHPTIIHDHQVWSLDFSPMTSHPWLLRSSQQWPELTRGDFPSHDHHPWACHPP